MIQANYLLTREEEYRLTVKLAGLIDRLEDIKAVLKQDIIPDDESMKRPLNLNPPLNSLNIEQDAPTQRWKKIYQAIPKGELTTFLDFLVTSNGTMAYGDPELKYFINLIDKREINKIDQLVNAVKLGKCILFLGPGILHDSKGEPFNQLFAHYLVNKLSTKEIYYDQDQANNLAYISQRYDELVRQKLVPKDAKNEQFLFKADNYNEQGWMASDFYQREAEQSVWRQTKMLYQMIAKFGFRTIINTNPDYNDLKEAIEENGKYQCIHAYYSLANGSVVDENPLSEEDSASDNYLEMTQEERVANWSTASKSNDLPKVLLYNLLGSFENPASVLTAERQLLAFTTRIVKEGPALPRPLTNLFLDPKSYLFLGFDFDQWFVRLIFDTVLKIDRTPDRSVSIYPSQHKTTFNQANREFFEKVFNMYFVTDELPLFLNKLARKSGIEL